MFYLKSRGRRKYNPSNFIKVFFCFVEIRVDIDACAKAVPIQSARLNSWTTAGNNKNRGLQYKQHSSQHTLSEYLSRPRADDKEWMNLGNSVKKNFKSVTITLIFFFFFFLFSLQYLWALAEDPHTPSHPLPPNQRRHQTQRRLLHGALLVSLPERGLLCDQQGSGIWICLSAGPW